MGMLLNLIIKPFCWVFNFFFGILAFLVLLLIAAGLTFNFWFPKIAPYVSIGDGAFALEVGKSKSNIFTANFNFHDVTVSNGKRFPIPNFIHADRASLDLLLLSIFSKRILVEKFVLEIPQLTYVRTADGRDNLTEFLNSFSDSDWSAGRTGVVSQAPRTKTIFFRHFELAIGKVISMDFGANSEPSKVRELVLNYRFRADDIELGELLRRLIADFKNQGVSFLMQAVMDSLSRLPGISTIVVPIIKANGAAADILSKGVGNPGKQKKGR
ncbi:MAG: hypothetical protein LBF24_00500 [Puniceicoccales bacterium]|jgi:hypothetical protein|nr:hypothetical protein [Puniceicoccales bacterium]